MEVMHGVLRVLRRQQRDSFILLRMSRTYSNSFLQGRVLTIRQIGGSKPQLATTVRNFSAGEQKLFTKKDDSISEMDVGPGEWQEVYKGILSTQIRMVKMFSLSTTMLGLMMQPMLVQKAAETSFGIVLAMGSFIGFFTFVTPMLIHWITKKYVTRLEYDPERDIYSATTLSFFLQEKKVEFKLGDIHVPSVPGMFTTFHAKKKPLFVDPRMFLDVEHYGRLMGYDKPIDFKMGEDKE